MEYAKFEDVLWPQLAEQSMAFEAIKLKGAWIGLYDMNCWVAPARLTLHACPGAGFSTASR